MALLLTVSGSVTGKVLAIFALCSLRSGIKYFCNVFRLECLVICITVSTTVLTELLYQIFMKQKTTISDLSAVVTGLLLALNLAGRGND